MKRAIAFLLITVLCACATDPLEKKGFVRSMNKWVGRSVDALVTANGAPANVFLQDSGGRIFEYSMTGIWTDEEEDWLGSHMKRRSNGVIRQTPDTRGVRLGPLRQNVLGAARTCTVSFFVSADSIIERWDLDEDSCY
jgi:hypothetical protein